MVDKTMLKRKIKKVTRIMGEIKEDQGSNNKLYRAYQRKIDRYNDLLDDASEEDSVLHGSADEASVLSPPQSQDIESDAEDEGHETETDDEPEEEAPKKKKVSGIASKIRGTPKMQPTLIVVSLCITEKEEGCRWWRGGAQEEKGAMMELIWHRLPDFVMFTHFRPWQKKKKPVDGEEVPKKKKKKKKPKDDE